ncbi:group-specific protein [Alteribacter lacisalsi]|uniref:Group-specific protein n=1 Tax=Alteribacter lacisalsi TaxID=2045244 RepID=A0A2W0H474_9BACI|nr:group-specific protein [Alteribacter lacisalsi]PYZ96644.1 group-specific protein [Alteribacter lacisalsi]
MRYVYHMVPKTMIGAKLIALNQLKTNQEELYNEYAKKYNDHPDREKLLERRIPKLDCLWNDVIHFLPLHPFRVYSALRETGVHVKDDVKFYKVPISNLKHNKNAFYLYSKDLYNGPAAEMNREDIRLIDVEEYEELSSIPADTVHYYKEEHSKGNRRFGMFPYIPHMLSLGEVDVSDAEIICWSDEID